MSASNGTSATPVDAIDEAFASLQTLETAYETQGRLAGASSGRTQGYAEGRETGWAAGTGITSELEYYLGAATALRSLSDTFPGRVGVGSLTAAEKLEKHISAHPLYKTGNDENLDMDTHLATARALFKRMTASARMHRLKWNALTNNPTSGSQPLVDLSF